MPTPLPSPTIIEAPIPPDIVTNAAGSGAHSVNSPNLESAVDATHHAAQAAMQGASQGAAHSAPLDINQLFWLLLIASLVAMLGRRIKIPYALALVVTGLLVGAPQLLPQVHLDPHTLFTVFLPPLLFESSLNLRIEPLRQNARTVALYALGGTLISTLIVGGLSHLLLGWPLPMALTFGALISPTDPISVVAVFKRLGVGKRLSLIVEAESLFNDGAAVVLFVLLTAWTMGENVTIASGLQQFLIVFLGGAGVGIAIGAVASRLTHEFDEHLLEIMLTTVVAFGAYLCAETIHVSGVIAVVVAGLVVGNYGMVTGMSPTTRLAVESFWEYAAFAVNSIVFLLLGIEVTFINLWGYLGATAIAIGIVLTGRAVAVYGLAPVSKMLHCGLPASWNHVLFWGSLRGALSMALVLGLPDNFPLRDTIRVVTFGVVLFSLMVQGLTIGNLLQKLQLTEKAHEETAYNGLLSEKSACHAAVRELERLHGKSAITQQVFETIEAEYQARLQHLEAEMETLHRQHHSLQEQQMDEARRAALVAEKSALREAEHSGLLDPEHQRFLVQELDARLAEVLDRRGGH